MDDGLNRLKLRAAALGDDAMRRTIGFSSIAFGLVGGCLLTGEQIVRRLTAIKRDFGVSRLTTPAKASQRSAFLTASVIADCKSSREIELPWSSNRFVARHMVDAEARPPVCTAGLKASEMTGNVTQAQK